MTTAGYLLAGRSEVICVAADGSVQDAVDVLTRHDISALAVTQGGALVGILTERDVVRKAYGAAEDVCVADIMTRELITVGSEQSIDDCMALMIQHHVRHLPVVADGRAVGMLSMRDLVGHVLAEKEFVIREMRSYISGAMLAPSTS